jgi:REP element-mobilizing transposase RayT
MGIHLRIKTSCSDKIWGILFIVLGLSRLYIDVMNINKKNNHSPKRKSVRLPLGEYNRPGFYFVTICTQNRLCLFGNIRNGKMYENESGKMLHYAWAKLTNLYCHVRTDQLVIMPDHIHVILEIKPNVDFISLPKIIHFFKTFTTARYIDGVRIRGWAGFNKKLWQRGYHEHIIRSSRDLCIIRQYIIDNPKKWKSRSPHPERIFP